MSTLSRLEDKSSVQEMPGLQDNKTETIELKPMEPDFGKLYGFNSGVVGTTANQLPQGVLNGQDKIIFGNLMVKGSVTTDVGVDVGTVGFVRGGQTAWNTGNGFWLGYDTGTYKFSLGNSVAGEPKITWDGIHTLTVEGDLSSNTGAVRFTSIIAPTAPTVVIGTAGAITGVYTYKITFVTNEGETQFGVESAVVSPSSEKVELTNIPLGAPSWRVIYRNIYRNKDGAPGVFYFVTSILDNTTTTYTDNTDDAGLPINPVNRVNTNTTAAFMYLDGVPILGDNGLGFYAGNGALSVAGSGYGNVAIGDNALSNATESIYNIGIGWGALSHQATGYSSGYNVAIGKTALNGVTTGSSNIAIGTDSQVVQSTGDYNISMGEDSLHTIVAGYENIGIGYHALYSTLGNWNVGIGAFALDSNDTGVNNSAIGWGAGYTGGITTYDNCTYLGANTQVTGSDQVQLGDAATTTYAYGAVQNRSDRRSKEDIKDIEVGLDFIMKLKPVSFKFKDFEVRDKKYEFHRSHWGLIAQDVKETLDEFKIDSGVYQDHSVNGGEDVKTLGYTELIAPLIKAIQEQQKQIDDLRAILDKVI